MKEMYLVVRKQKISDDDLKIWLNAMLAKGWKLLSITADNQYIFERIML